MQGSGGHTWGSERRARAPQVLMVATDVYRPAAIEQLVALGERVSVPVFEMGTGERPAAIAAAGLAKGRAEGFDAVIVDTAGRLQARMRAKAVHPSDLPCKPGGRGAAVS